MAIAVHSEGDQTTSGTTVHTLATITSLGVYRLWLDLNALLPGATPDLLQVIATIKVNAGETAKNAMVPRRFYGGRVVLPIWKSPDIDCDTELIFSIQMVQGSNRTIPWKIYKAS